MQSGPLFRNLILKYTKIFLATQTLVFDLAPYLGYLPECNSQENVESEIVDLFDHESAVVTDDN